MDSAKPTTAQEAPLSLGRAKKKPSRLGLYTPFLLLAAAFGLWSLYWLYMAHDIAGRLKVSENELVKAGYSVTHDPIIVRGYPFRMFVEIHKLDIVSSKGRGLSSPLISTEAAAYALDKWVLVAPHGFIWHRGHANGVDLGDVSVTADAKGSALRASMSHLFRPVPDLRLEFVNPVFLSSNTQHPFALTSADRLEAYVRPSSAITDSADFLWRVDGGRGSIVSAAGPDGKPVKFDWHVEGRMSNVSSFKGGDLSDRFTSWRNSGGTAGDLKASLGWGEINMFMTSPAIGLDAASSLHGQLNVELSGHGDAYGVLRAAKLISPQSEGLARSLWKLPPIDPEKPVKLKLDLHDGGAYVGPLRLSDTPVMP